MRQNTLGGRVRLVRMLAGLSQSDFAKALDMTGANLSSIELGKSRLTSQMFDKLASVFSVNWAYCYIWVHNRIL
jgi:transcriptional regulator with XRE-family HTH domain